MAIATRSTLCTPATGTGWLGAPRPLTLKAPQSRHLDVRSGWQAPLQGPPLRVQAVAPRLKGARVAAPPLSIEAILAALDAGQAPCYKDFQYALALAGQSNKAATRTDFLHLFNTYGAPRLTNTEAALQFLCMHTDYLYLQPGAKICMAAQQDLFGRDRADYAPEIILKERFVDTVRGGTVSIYAPDPQRHPEGRWLFIPRGTAASRARDVMAVNMPTGLRADIDVDGIGCKFVAHNAAALLQRLAEPLDRGQRITLAGHSLGGAVALHLMSLLAPEQQRLCEVRTFNAPGISRRTIRQLVWPSRILMVRAPLDLATYVGEQHPDAAVVYPTPRRRSVADRILGHGVPQLAQQQLDGLPLRFATVVADHHHTCWVIEAGRKILGRCAYDRVEP